MGGWGAPDGGGEHGWPLHPASWGAPEGGARPTSWGAREDGGEQVMPSLPLEVQHGEAILNLKDRRLGDDGLNTLLRHLEGHWFPSCRAALRLAPSWPLPLTALHLGENRLGDAGAQALVSALLQQRVLVRKLWLFKNNLCAASAGALARYIELAPEPVEELHLSHNYFGRSDVSGMLAAVATRPEYPLPGDRGARTRPLWMRVEQQKGAVSAWGLGVTESEIIRRFRAILADEDRNMLSIRSACRQIPPGPPGPLICDTIVEGQFPNRTACTAAQCSRCPGWRGQGPTIVHLPHFWCQGPNAQALIQRKPKAARSLAGAAAARGGAAASRTGARQAPPRAQEDPREELLDRLGEHFGRPAQENRDYAFLGQVLPDGLMEARVEVLGATFTSPPLTSKTAAEQQAARQALLWLRSGGPPPPSAGPPGAGGGAEETAAASRQLEEELAELLLGSAGEEAVRRSPPPPPPAPPEAAAAPPARAAACSSHSSTDPWPGPAGLGALRQQCAPWTDAIERPAPWRPPPPEPSAPGAAPAVVGTVHVSIQSAAAHDGAAAGRSMAQAAPVPPAAAPAGPAAAAAPPPPAPPAPPAPRRAPPAPERAAQVSLDGRPKGKGAKLAAGGRDVCWDYAAGMQRDPPDCNACPRGERCKFVHVAPPAPRSSAGPGGGKGASGVRGQGKSGRPAVEGQAAKGGKGGRASAALQEPSERKKAVSDDPWADMAQSNTKVPPAARQQQAALSMAVASAAADGQATPALSGPDLRAESQAGYALDPPAQQPSVGAEASAIELFQPHPPAEDALSRPPPPPPPRQPSQEEDPWAVMDTGPYRRAGAPARHAPPPPPPPPSVREPLTGPPGAARAAPPPPPPGALQGPPGGPMSEAIISRLVEYMHTAADPERALAQLRAPGSGVSPDALQLVMQRYRAEEARRGQ